ncbi:MAG: hypothetical protein Q7T53_10830 [Deltaproteobacteria bacterium]|nr:hypothetical protein [Deltaproteobacteria bacterium]
MNKFLWYGIYFSIAVNTVTVLAPVLLWMKNSFLPEIVVRIITTLFGFIIALYLPFAFLLIYPALAISLIITTYVSIQLSTRENSDFRNLLFVSMISLILNIVAIYFRHMMAMPGKGM